MATIGLDRLYYAKITENDAGEETYGTPEQLAKAISADRSVELAEAALRRHPTSQVRPSTKTRYSFLHPRTAATLWR